MKKKTIVVVVLIAVIGGLAGLSTLTKAKKEFKSVRTTEVTQGDMQVYLSTTALIQSRDVREYYGPQAKVSKVNVKVGDKVKTGDTLVTYDVQDLKTSVEDSIEADRYGVVTAVNVAEGGIGSQQQAVVVTQSLENLKATLYVSRYDANKIKLNQKALIKNADSEYHGTVSYIAPIAEKSASGDASLAVDVKITDKSPRLKVGFETDIDILLNKVKNVIKVPVESIKTDKTGRSVVYVIQDNKAVEKEVKVGVQSDTEVQIIEGLQLGEKVILNPTDEIQNGTLVKTEGIREGIQKGILGGMRK